MQQLQVSELMKKVPNGKVVLSKTKKALRENVLELFHPRHLRCTLQLWMLWFGAAFSYYGMLVASSDILLEATSVDLLGNNAVDLLGNTTSPVLQTLTASGFGASGFGGNCRQLQNKDYIYLVLTALGELVYLPVSVWLTDRLGRRYTGCLNLVGCGVFFILLNITSPKWLVLVFLFFVRGFGAATLNWVYLYSAEVYPNSLRSTGIVAASVWARVGAVATPFVAQILLRQSMTNALLVYGFVSLACSLAALIMPDETKTATNQENSEQSSNNQNVQLESAGIQPIGPISLRI